MGMVQDTKRRNAMTHTQAAKQYARLTNDCSRLLRTLESVINFESDHMEGRVPTIQTPAQFQEDLKEAHEFFYGRLKWAAGVK